METKGHKRCLEALMASISQSDEKADLMTLATGHSGSVPRIDRFRLAATITARHDTYQARHLPCLADFY